jgi:hypothetical protein
MIKIKLMLSIMITCSFSLVSIAQTTIREDLPEVKLIKQYDEPVISTHSKGAEDIKFGFEGGTAVKVGDTYHIFTSEMINEPFWVKMRHGHWISKDRIHWERVSTIRESSGEFEGKDPRASLWSPMVYFDEASNRWNMFYVAYYAQPNKDKEFRWNERGRIYRSISLSVGKQGIFGPYKDLGVVLEPGKDSDSWEGNQGTDSFYPWKVGDKYYAFYGSCSSSLVSNHWLVGIATSQKLEGPWKRMSDQNPSQIEKKFIENPIVTPLASGGFFCIYDNDKSDAMGWSFSKNGVDWSSGQSLIIQPKSGKWSSDVRTILGIINEGNNKYTVFYTGFEKQVDWDKLFKNQLTGISCGIGFAEIEIKPLK